MVRTCALWPCASKFKKGLSVKVKQFPRDKIQREKWEAWVRIQNRWPQFKAKDSSCLCEDHFDTKWIMSSGRLSKDAVPTVAPESSSEWQFRFGLVPTLHANGGQTEKQRKCGGGCALSEVSENIGPPNKDKEQPGASRCVLEVSEPDASPSHPCTPVCVEPPSGREHLSNSATNTTPRTLQTPQASGTTKYVVLQLHPIEAPAEEQTENVEEVCTVIDVSDNIGLAYNDSDQPGTSVSVMEVSEPDLSPPRRQHLSISATSTTPMILKTPQALGRKRYFGDLKESDFSTPERRAYSWNIAKTAYEKTTHRLKIMQQSVRRATKRIEHLESLLSKLKNKRYISEELSEEIETVLQKRLKPLKPECLV